MTGQSRGYVRDWLYTLDPGYFAAVMATGIVSIAARLLGFTVLADVFVVMSAIALLALAASYVARAILIPARVLSSLRIPGSAVSYFTVVAGIDVFATGILSHGLWPVALIMGALAFGIWLILTYGLFSSIVLAGNRPRLRDMNGGWLVWVVGTQSVAVLAAAIAAELPQNSTAAILAAASVLFWGVGVVLYLILVVIIFLRLFLVETTPAQMGPAYWILMGATAISVRAAAGILAVGTAHPEPLLTEMRPFVIGLSVVLWAFGSWFIPLLVLFGLWRYFVRGYSWAYEPKLWSVVFPLGMYTVASATLGSAIKFGFMQQVASVGLWVAVGAWAAVAVLLLIALTATLRRGRAQNGSRG